MYKKWTLMIFLPLLILIMYFFDVYLGYRSENKIAHGIYLICYSLPPFIIVIILGIAFLNLRGISNEFY